MSEKDFDKLSTLVGLFDTTAKMGGTPLLSRVQQHVAKELEEVLDDMDEQDAEDNELRNKTKHEVETTGNATLTTAPLTLKGNPDGK